LSVVAVTTGWDPSSGVTFTYVWKRANTQGGEGTVISGAISSSYLLVAADNGKYISVTVTANKAGYTSVTRSGEHPYPAFS
jgi:hypothetical protein